jgi:hypothetical protein
VGFHKLGTPITGLFLQQFKSRGELDTLPSLKPSPRMGLGFYNAEMGRLEGTLPALNTRRGR